MKKFIYPKTLACSRLTLSRERRDMIFIFIKSFFNRNTLQKILILFTLGLFLRFLVNNFLSEGITEELLVGLIGGALLPFNFPLSIGDLNMRIVNDNMALINIRPRDYIINHDYEIKDKCKRKLH
jgi:hypothetical protein